MPVSGDFLKIFQGPQWRSSPWGLLHRASWERERERETRFIHGAPLWCLDTVFLFLMNIIFYLEYLIMSNSKILCLWYCTLWDTHTHTLALSGLPSDYRCIQQPWIFEACVSPSFLLAHFQLSNSTSVLFSTCRDRPWGPPNLLYNGYRVFPGRKERPGRDTDPSPPSSAVGHERVELHLYSPYGLYSLYRGSVPVQGWPLPLLLYLIKTFRSRWHFRDIVNNVRRSIEMFTWL